MPRIDRLSIAKSLINRKDLVPTRNVTILDELIFSWLQMFEVTRLDSDTFFWHDKHFSV